MLSFHHPILINQTKRPLFIKFLFSLIHHFIKLIEITLISQIKRKRKAWITFQDIYLPCLATMICCSILIIDFDLCIFWLIIKALFFENIICKINFFSRIFFKFTTVFDFIVFILFNIETNIVLIALLPIFEDILFIMRYTFLNQMRIKEKQILSLHSYKV